MQRQRWWWNRTESLQRIRKEVALTRGYSWMIHVRRHTLLEVQLFSPVGTLVKFHSSQINKHSPLNHPLPPPSWYVSLSRRGLTIFRNALHIHIRAFQYLNRRNWKWKFSEWVAYLHTTVPSYNGYVPLPAGPHGFSFKFAGNHPVFHLKCLSIVLSISHTLALTY